MCLRPDPSDRAHRQQLQYLTATFNAPQAKAPQNRRALSRSLFRLTLVANQPEAFCIITTNAVSPHQPALSVAESTHASRRKDVSQMLLWQPPRRTAFGDRKDPPARTQVGPGILSKRARQGKSSRYKKGKDKRYPSARQIRKRVLAAPRTVRQPTQNWIYAFEGGVQLPNCRCGGVLRTLCFRCLD